MPICTTTRKLKIGSEKFKAVGKLQNIEGVGNTKYY